MANRKKAMSSHSKKNFHIADLVDGPTFSIPFLHRYLYISQIKYKGLPGPIGLTMFCGLIFVVTISSTLFLQQQALQHLTMQMKIPIRISRAMKPATQQPTMKYVNPSGPIIHDKYHGYISPMIAYLN